MDASFLRTVTRDFDRKFFAAKDDRAFIGKSRLMFEADECFLDCVFRQSLSTGTRPLLFNLILGQILAPQRMTPIH